MDTLLSPFSVLRRNIAIVFAPAIPILFLLAFLVFSQGVHTSSSLLDATDSYLGMTVHLSAANILAFDNISTDIQIPLIRLAGIAEKTDIRELFSSDQSNFFVVFTVLFLGFISYSMVSRVVYSIKKNERSIFGLRGINPASIVLSLLAAFLMLFIASFSLGGFKLLLVITFGIYFTFSIPFAASGQPVGESIFQGFKFMSHTSKIVTCFLGSMGAAVMVPIALLIFTAPLIINMESTSMTNILKLAIGLFAVVFGLFYQMALCASEVFANIESVKKEVKTEEAV